MMRLLIVRHGQSEWNAQGRVQGQAAGVRLTSLGRRQALDAAALLRGRGASLLLASDLLRARHTADLIGAQLGLAVETTPTLREQALGELEGRLAGELVAQPVPDGLDISEVRWGGGESIADVHVRLAAFVGRLRERADGQTVILVTHGGPIAVLDAVLAGRGHREVTWDAVGNGQIVERVVD